MATIGQLVLQLKADTSAFSRGLADAKKYAFDSSADIVSSLGKIGTQLGKMDFGTFRNGLKSLENLGGIMAGVGVATATAVVAIAESTAQQVKSMDKLSQSYGLSIEQISGLRAASKLTGVDMEVLTAGMSRLARNAAQMATSGTGPASAAFQALGLNVTDSSGKLRPMNDLLLDVAGKFSGMADGTTKTALAVQLFGRSGAALIPFLNQGREGIQQMLDISKELGLTWSGNDAAAAKQFAAQVDILELKSTAFKEALARGVLPALNDIVSAFVKVDGSGHSLATTMGQDVGSALVVIAKTALAAATGLQEMYQALRLMKVQWSEGQDSAAAQQIMAEFDRLQKNWEKRTEQMNAGFTFSLKGAGGGKGGPVPGFGTPDDITALGNALDKLGDKTKQLLDKAEGDKVAAQMDKIAAQIRDIASFESQHPGAIWTQLNKQVEDLTSALEHLRFTQKQILAEMGDAAAKAQIGTMLSIPIAGPQATGEVQQQAQWLKYQQDIDAQRRDSLSLYEQTQTAGERWAQELTKLNFLQHAGVLSQETYNRSLQKMSDSINASLDPWAKYNAEQRKYDDLVAKGIPLTDASRVAMQKQLDVLKAQAAAQTGGIGGGIGAGISVFNAQMPTIGTTAMNATLGALRQMQSGFQNFFRSILSGTTSIGQAFSALGLSILDSMASAFAEIVAQWIMTNLVMKAVSAIFGEDFGNNLAKTKQQNAEIAMSSAAVAGANTLALTSLMYPPPAPEILSGVAYAMGMMYAGLASAAGGMDVRGNQLAKLHDREMVLPAHLADRVRAVTPSGGGGASGPVIHFSPNYTIQALDKGGVEDVLHRHRQALAGELRRLVRDGAFKIK